MKDSSETVDGIAMLSNSCVGKSSTFFSHDQLFLCAKCKFCKAKDSSESLDSMSVL